MPGTSQLLRTGKSRRSRTDHRHFFPGLAFRRLRRNPSLLPALVDDRVFDGLDADGIVVDVQRAGRLARRRTDPPGELGKIIGRMQYIECLLPILLVDEVVPVRNDVVDGASGHAERNTAIHAARALQARFLIGKMENEFAIMFDALALVFRGLGKALVLHESGDLAHSLSSLVCRFAEAQLQTRAGDSPAPIAPLDNLCRQLAPLRRHFAERATILRREHLDEFGAIRRPVVEYFPGAGAAGITRVPLDESLENCLVGQPDVP